MPFRHEEREVLRPGHSTGCGLWYRRLRQEDIVTGLTPVFEPVRTKRTHNGLRYRPSNPPFEYEDLALSTTNKTLAEADQPSDFASVSITVPVCVHCGVSFLCREAYEAHYDVNHQLPIHFVDAFGKSHSFPWHLCKSWEGMESLIKQGLRHIDCIGDDVDQGLYKLSGLDGETILPQVWKEIVHPGLFVGMQFWWHHDMIIQAASTGTYLNFASVSADSETVDHGLKGPDSKNGQGETNLVLEHWLSTLDNAKRPRPKRKSKASRDVSPWTAWMVGGEVKQSRSERRGEDSKDISPWAAWMDGGNARPKKKKRRQSAALPALFGRDDRTLFPAVDADANTNGRQTFPPRNDKELY